MENIAIGEQERFNNRIRIKSPASYVTTACDVCDKWEATVKFNKTKLCDDCASEEGIERL